MLSAIQEKSVRLESSLQSAKLESVQQLTPEKMLATQIGLVQSIIEVDLVAKTAGSAAQSVNKLTSMQ
nr:type III secretion system inner rod subunit SctI [Vibrio sinus]